jgi:hypothetical protein
MNETAFDHMRQYPEHELQIDGESWQCFTCEEEDADDPFHYDYEEDQWW